MRIPYLLLLIFLFTGCDGNRAERERRRAALDALLSSGQVCRVEFVNRQHDRTNVFSAEKAAHILALLSATNRIDQSAPDTKHYANWIYLFRNETPFRLEYYAQQQVLSFRGYRFALKGTNELPMFFQ